MYLAALMDIFSEYVLNWSVSNSRNSLFCLDETLEQSGPEVFNMDQGGQFTCKDFEDKLKDAGVRISMNGKGRTFDNILVERLWRIVKYGDIYLKQ